MTSYVFVGSYHRINATIFINKKKYDESIDEFVYETHSFIKIVCFFCHLYRHCK